jgi:squalene-hopene/tetraprenyl-beta-curcumene cyclase
MTTPSALRSERQTSSESEALTVLRESLLQGCRNLLNQQHPEGYWWYTLEANDSINAEYIFLLHYLGRSSPETEAALGCGMLQNQNKDGSWSLFYQGPGDISTTVECYLALKLSGHDVESKPMAKARQFILKNGGITKMRIFSRVHLALLGLVSWEICPQMPVGFMNLPSWGPVSIYEFSSWARACVVPLLVIMDQRKTRPVSVTLDELYPDGPERAKWGYPSKDFLSFDTVFIQLDKILQVADKLRIKPLRGSALKACETYIREHIRETADIFPAMFYGVLALNSLGYSLNDQDVQIGLDGLKSFHIPMSQSDDVIAIPFQSEFHALNPRNESSTKSEQPNPTIEPPLLYQQCCISPVWDTAWAGVALRDAGTPSDHPELIKAARWLIKKQITDVRGDWSVKNKAGPAGGWSFEFLNKYYPDIDDTIEVLMFLHEVDLPYRELKKPFESGLNWLLSMQSKNGGFAAFDKDNDMEILNKIPFADHGACLDPATADITGRMIEFLAGIGYDLDSDVVQRAADFIMKQQSPDGSFWGRWGVSYVYGTWGALGGLCALNRPEDRGVIAKAIAWLKSVQNADGGFGESCLSDAEGKFIPAGESVASQTAWALMTFVSAGEARSTEAGRAAAWLVANQRESGTWDERHFTGTGFPGHFYIRYHGYRNFFPVMALGRYEKTLSAKCFAGDSNPGHFEA